jgi:hypothetical protein
MRFEHVSTFYRLARLIIQWMESIHILIRNNVVIDQAMSMQLILRGLPYPQQFICNPILSWIHSEVQLSFCRQLQRLPFAKRNTLKIFFCWFFFLLNFLLALYFCIFLLWFLSWPWSSALILFLFLLLTESKHESS